MAERERRFLLTRAAAGTFLTETAGWLTLDVYDLARPFAYARTTYFDDFGSSYLRSSERPVVERLRLREYAASRGPGDTPTLTGAAFLELKAIRGVTRAKVRVAAPADVLAAWVNRHGDPPPAWRHRLMRQEGFPALQERLRRDRLRPRVVTWYRRVSLTGEQIRVTLDEGLSFARPSPLGVGAGLAMPTHAVDHLGGRVLEVKTSGGEPSWLAAAVAKLTPAASFSKFCQGMLALGHPVPSVAQQHTAPLEVTNVVRLVNRG